MTLRCCSTPGCPALVKPGTRGGRCTDCERGHDQARGNFRERGYDAAYETAKRDPDYLAATHCETCGQAFTTDNPKTAGHRTALRNGGDSKIKPECQDCNFGWRRTGS